MNDAPKKRPWLQFHLSTAVVLMFVAALLMHANVRSRETWRSGWKVHGFPLDAIVSTTQEHVSEMSSMDSKNGRILSYGFPYDGVVWLPFWGANITVNRFVLNFAFGILALLGIALACERGPRALQTLRSWCAGSKRDEKRTE